MKTQNRRANDTHVKGAIGVISMLHYCFEKFGLGEKECHLHCDNASGLMKFLEQD